MNNDNQVSVSVVIPTYRRYAMLREAVKSVLEQTCQNLEIIVIDDCSGDDTAKIAEIAPQIIYLCNQKNSGPGYSRKVGLQQSRGEFIVFLDDDDYYTDCCFFQKALDILNANPGYSFVAANAAIRYECDGHSEQKPLNVHGEMLAAEYLEGFPFANKKPHSTFTTMFRKSVLLEAGVDKMQMVNDIPIFMRCLAAGGSVFFMENEIGVYRIHGNNISKKITPEFIIENLKEKMYVLTRIKEEAMFADYNTWWHRQVNGTVNYYVYGSHPTRMEYFKVWRWCIKASEDKKEVRKILKEYADYLTYHRWCAVKNCVKRLLGITE